MAYELTPEMAQTITDVELAFGTDRLLPPASAIPEDFLFGIGEAQAYVELVSAIFYGQQLPACEIELAEGVAPEVLNKCVRAHLESWQPKHEHKMAGVAYMVSLLARLFPIKERA